MRYVKLLGLALVVGIVVALTYFLFEQSVRHSITYIWDDLLHTESRRLLVLPLCIGMTLLYFGLQHRLDPASEQSSAEGLGTASHFTILEYSKVLFLGFFSLVAGASLGPEAVLVPACIIVGGFIGQRIMRGDKTTQKEAVALGFIALFAAFFNSFIVGMLSMLLVKKQFKLSINRRLVILGAIASATVVGMLKVLEGSAYVDLPSFSWKVNMKTIGAVLILFVAGYLATNLLKQAHTMSVKLARRLHMQQWGGRALLAGIGLSILYLLGGPLVQFTGNEAIQPMLQQSKELGLFGLIGIAVVKVVAIAWSKAAGYRGGLIFPSLFVAATLVAAVEVTLGDINFIYALLATLLGLFAADKKAKILL